MRLEILMSAMHQLDFSIVKQSNINSSILIINQGNFCNDEYKGNARMISTLDRGLSKSRNLAIQETRAEIGLLADDDEVFRSDLEQIIIQSYQDLPQADIIIFSCDIQKNGRIISKDLANQKIKKLSFLDILKVASYQISFRSDRLREKEIYFDEKLGSGTGNGAGEENKFLLDCLKKGLEIYYVPIYIATVSQDGQSQWFFGFDKQFFYNHGRTTRYIYGLPFAVVYGLYFIVRKYPLYRDTLSMGTATKHLFRGLFTRNQL